ncbi:MAG: ATP-binding protein [Nannocystaceae bacterium]
MNPPRCDRCAFERLDELDDDDLVHAIVRCGACPQLAEPRCRALFDRLRGATAALRRCRNLAHKRGREALALRQAAHDVEDRLARLEAVHKISSNELEGMTTLMWLLSEIAAAANAATNAEEMIYLCLRPLCEATGLGIGVALFGDELGMHYIAAATDPGAVGDALAAIESSSWLSALRFATEPQWIDLREVSQADVGATSWRRQAHDAGLCGALGIPVVVDGEPIASCVLLCTDARKIDKEAIETIVDAAWSSLAAQISRVISRERAAEATEGARAAAESANRAKSDFVANMSHELRTPLNAIIGYGELLVEDLEEFGLNDPRAIVERMNGASRHLLGLINNILDLSKIEAGKMSVHSEPVDLAAEFEEVLAVLEPLVEDGGNRLRCELPALDRPLLLDGIKLRQILFNLIGNAAKFTRNGTIRVLTELVLEGDAAALRVSIEDSGIGMSEEQLARVFEAFTQAESDTTRRFGGTGLGLTLSRRLAELLGGTLTARSALGVGSTFVVELPTRALEPRARAR